MKIRPRKPSASAGFSMVEVLVAIVILTFGLLGMVGMQAAALHSNREARLQSAAANMGRELADMIRGNKQACFQGGATTCPYVGAFTSPLTAATPSYCLNVAATGICADTTAIANAEMTEWLGRVDAELPGARVVVCQDAAPYSASGLPQWGCTAGAGAPIAIKIGWTQGSTDKSKTGVAAFVRATDTGATPLVVLPVSGVY